MRTGSSSRIVMLGTAGVFSLTVFQHLLGKDADVVAVAAPGTASVPPGGGSLPVFVPSMLQTMAAIAERQGIPVYRPSHPKDNELLNALHSFRPGFILVACFPWRLPASICAFPGAVCLNLHPSLLPRYRGPTPLFWQFRAGERITGITLHRVTAKLDSGDILEQVTRPLPDGITGDEIERLLAKDGARLFLETLARHREDRVAATVQNETHGSYFSTPKEDDFRISSDWSARRAFNFMRGTSGFGGSYRIGLEGKYFHLRTALKYQSEAVLGHAWEVAGNEIRIQLSPGVLKATL